MLHADAVPAGPTFELEAGEQLPPGGFMRVQDVMTRRVETIDDQAERGSLRTIP